MYDTTRKETFERIENWWREIETFGGQKSASIMLIGTKADLIEKRAVDTKRGKVCSQGK